MGEIVLVRHGQASFGADDYDKLSRLGHQQAEWLGRYFSEHGISFDRTLCGSLRRHRETAAGIARTHNMPAPDVDPRLNEMDYDDLQEAYIRATGVDAPTERQTFLEHFPRIFESWENGALEQGTESFTDFQARVTAAIEDALMPDRTTLIVTSGGVIGITLQRVLGLSAGKAADLLLNIHNASVHRLTLEHGVVRLALFNGSPHLEQEDRRHARTFI